MPQIDNGLDMMHRLNGEINFVATKPDPNHLYTMNSSGVRKERLEPGEHITNCIVCKSTCHYPCYIPEDSNKFSCTAMDSTTKRCKVCMKQCLWNVHRNDGVRFIRFEETVSFSVNQLLKRYETNISKSKDPEKLLSCLRGEYGKWKSDVVKMMHKMVRCVNRLREIAEKPDRFDVIQYIVSLMDAEKNGNKPGRQGRISELEKLRTEVNNQG